jgi:hypothetical protein
MSEQPADLHERIESCRDLLDVFQKERQLLQSGQPMKPANILDMLQLKLRLVDSMADSQGAIQGELERGRAGNTPDEGKREQIRELGSLLEKLLVIERENQMLLRRLIAAEPGQKPVADTPQSAPRPQTQGMAPLVGRLQQIRSANPEAVRHAER